MSTRCARCGCFLYRAVEIFSGCLLQSGAGFYNIGHSEFSQTAFSGCLAAVVFVHWGSLKIISNHPFQSSHGVIMSWINFVRRCRFWARRKWRQMRRLSRKSVPLLYLLIGSLLVAGVSMIFAQMAEFALEQNRHWVKTYPWFAWVALPFGLMAIA